MAGGPALTPAVTAAARPSGFARLPLLLLAGFGAAVLLRSTIGGAGVARSVPAALVFATALAGLGAVSAVGLRPRPATVPQQLSGARRQVAAVAVGLAGAVILCLPAVVHRVGGVDPFVPRPGAGFVGWALVVTVVAGAEEAFLRGSLYRSLLPLGVPVAIAVPAAAFALLHLPLYGWGAVPLDAAVGVWLGALRTVTGGWTAPAVAHVLADWAAFWLA